MIKLLALILSMNFGSYVRTDYVNESAFAKARKVMLAKYVRSNGTWMCVYTGKVVKTSDSLDIDHIVPLKYADDHGMAAQPSKAKKALGIDTLNLVPVTAHINRSKGDKGPAQFMPSKNKCFYVSRWDSVVTKYGIALDSADAATLKATKRYCH